MKQNIHSVDRIARIILGVVLLSLTVVGPQTLWGLTGIIFIATAFLNFCPIYFALGISTKPKIETEKLNSK